MSMTTRASGSDSGDKPAPGTVPPQRAATKPPPDAATDPGTTAADATTPDTDDDATTPDTDEARVESDGAPAEADHAPAEAGSAPPEADDVPAEADHVPVGTADVPAGADDDVAGADDDVAEAGSAPPEADDAPAEADDAPAKADHAPAEADHAPAEPADVPAGADDGPGEAAPARTAAPKPEVRPLGRRRRSTRAGLVVAFLCGVLGFALAAQLQTNEGDNRLASARQSDLVRILDELNAREERLRSEISDLEFRRQTINSKAQGSEAALTDARRRATELGILAGTIPAEGPGLVITFTEQPGRRLSASTILDAVEELRGAGAEALQIDGAGRRVIRIGASTYFTDTEDGIIVDGTRINGPYVLTVIGDPPTMDGGLKIPGGIVETVRQAGGTTRIEQRRTVQITAVREAPTPKFARPAS